MAGSFGIRENVRRFLKQECSAAEQDALYKELVRIREDPGAAIVQSLPVLDQRLVDRAKRRGEYATLGSFEFGGCRAAYAYYPRRNYVEVIECRRLNARREEKRGGSG